MFVKGILLLYHRPPIQDATNVQENVNAFAQLSKFPVCSVNTTFGFPQRLRALQFETVVFHYSLFDPLGYRLGKEFLDYLDEAAPRYKIAFFQDEHHYCQQRFAFLNRHSVDCVYTLLEPQHFEEIYGKYTSVRKLVSHIPGYVSDDLVAIARRVTKPERDRTVDIGYRGRRLPFYMGRGAQEKYEIGLEFRKRASSSGLRLDIEVEEPQRIYGRDWNHFLANCRAVLGGEAGVSVFDLEDAVRIECQRLIDENPSITFEEVSERVLHRWEDKIYYRTIGPRHFEAAALRVCQILFEGKYYGIMQPMVHYIPLKKDFSNFDDVITTFKDDGLRAELSENAYRDLIASGRYSYARFIEGFDEEMIKSGLQPVEITSEVRDRLAGLAREARQLERKGVAKAALYNLVINTRPISIVGKPSLRVFKKFRGVAGEGAK